MKNRKEKLEKSPLQNDKKEVVNEILDKHDKTETENEQPKPKRKYTKRKPIIPEPVYTEENAQNDSNFLCELINEFRVGSGITPMKEKHQMFFALSSKQLFLKYGSTTSKWMPEIMFTGTFMFILVDTYKEMQILKLKQAKEKKDKKPVKKADLIK